MEELEKAEAIPELHAAGEVSTRAVYSWGKRFRHVFLG
jgi:hypothetical protein